MTLTIPPLRDRKEQIIPLAQYFFHVYQFKYGRTSSSLSLKTLRTFKDLPWPGNIQELEHVVKQIVLFGEEATIVRDLLKAKPGDNGGSGPSDVSRLVPSNEEECFDLRAVGRKAAETAEKEMIESTLKETHWNRKHAATLLRISYKALINKIEKYHLNERKEIHWSGESHDEGFSR
jgi:two-component system, NtrC family, response regulator AtoC